MANQYVNKLVKDGVTKLDLTNDTVTPETLAEGVTAHDASGAQIVGTGELKPVALELGLRVDFENKTFTRLGDAVGLNGGSDFDDFPMYKRRRCNLADDGTVNAYLGDDNYKADGSNGQVMVEQPKFYYKTVLVAHSESDTALIEIAEYWVSDQPLEGYKLHPSFYDRKGKEIDNFYIGAYEGDVQSNTLRSISGVKPTEIKTRSNARTNANNRGTGWKQETIWSWSADQLLMLIEYGKFNMQEAIGNGYVYAGNDLYTGTLDSYGNSSYGTTENNTTAVQWRGKENPWGNRYTWVDGINIQGQSIYIANTYSFVDGTANNYTKLNAMIPSWQSTSSTYYLVRLGYVADYDWLFFPYKEYLDGDSALPIGDIFKGQTSGWKIFRSSGNRTDAEFAGPFVFNIEVKNGDALNYHTCARLLYVG